MDNRRLRGALRGRDPQTTPMRLVQDLESQRHHFPLHGRLRFGVDTGVGEGFTFGIRYGLDTQPVVFDSSVAYTYGVGFGSFTVPRTSE